MLHDPCFYEVMRDQIVTALDIGTSTVYTVIAHKRDGSSAPQIIGVGAVPSWGMRSGRVVDPAEVIKSIQHSIRGAERSAGVRAERVYVGVGGNHLHCMPTRGVVAVSRADQEISSEDIERVMAAAQTISFPPNRMMLHVFPREYIVDGEVGLRDVLGMTGVRLEVNALIVGAATPHLNALRHCIDELGIEVAGLVANPFAAAHAVLTKRQKELGVVCIDIGGGTTSLVVFEEGNMLHTAVLPVGSLHITNDLAIGLRTPVDTAEHIKKEYGLALAREAGKRDVVDLAKIDPEEERAVLRKDIADIMEARLAEIFDWANKELRKIGKEAFLPGGVVLVGGGAKIPHIVDLAKERMRLPVQIGFPREAEGIVDSIDDPAYATVAGILFWGFEMEGEGKGSMPNFASFNNSVGKMKKWFRAFLP